MFVDYIYNFSVQPAKMPRSNKKKKTFHPVVPAFDTAIKDLLSTEKFTMIARAIVSTLIV